MASNLGMQTNRFKHWDTEKLLKVLVSQDHDIVIDEDGVTIFNEILHRIPNEDISSENISVLMQGMSKLCSISSRTELVKLLRNFIDNTILRTKLSMCIVSIPNMEKDHALGFLNSITEVLQLICEVLPTYSIQTVIVLVSLLSNSMRKDDLYKSIETKICMLQECQDQIIKDIKNNSVKRVKTINIEPPNSFRNIDIMPCTSDIYLDARPFLRKNVLYGPYRDVEHYLDVQFRLLREDFVMPIRNAITKMKAALIKGYQTPYLDDGRLYKRVHILGVACQNDGVSTLLRFDQVTLSKVNWITSKRLMPGSLVCLSRDKFQTLQFGIVTQRDLDKLSEGYFCVKFDDNTSELLGTNPFQEYDMIESVAYFEAYKYNLAVLREIEENDLPMKKYILNQTMDPDVDKEETPVYLRSEKNINYDLRCLLKENRSKIKERYNLAKCVNMIDYEAWPTAKDMGMDQSQYQALQQALTKEFSIIQGPPGTGKTYLGLKILQVLLHNRRNWASNKSPKILIACYTNHALDQFLEGILDIFPELCHAGLVRIGGHKNSPQRVMDCNLKAKTSFHRRNTFLKEKVEEDLNYMSDLLRGSISGIVYDHDMERIIGPHNIRALSNQYRLFPEYLHAIPIVILWLCMGEKDDYQPHVYSTMMNDQKSKEQNQKDANDEDDNNEEFQKIISDTISLLGDKTKKGTSFQTFSEQFQGEIVLTYDDVITEQVREDLFQLFYEIPHSKKILINQLLRSDYMSMKQAREVQSYRLWRMTEQDRWKIYRSWLLQYHEEKRAKIKDLCREYNDSVEDNSHEKRLEEIRVLQRANIIGITTTGAAKYRNLISAVNPQIFIIEEAAEILESHIITTLTPSCEHLILIGDHQQLRPNPTSYTLAREFNLGISLFERMIKNKMHLNTLSVQHRMKPAFSRLLVPHIYKHLNDHEHVLSYPSIKGVGGDIYFLNHKQNESNNAESRSHSNKHEANFVVGFCRYLIRQGYQESDITVLTTYKGQQFLIKDMMKGADISLKTSQPKDSGKKESQIHVVTVDNFQGEENNIIILSLVRSNDTGNIGFLKMSNRVCVALSRAKHGFYAIGNMKQLANNSKIWSKILVDLEMQKLLVDNIPLFCHNHPETLTRVNKRTDFDRAPEGGCVLPCDFRLKCGHVCILKCHPYDREHCDYVCEKPCTESCPYEHPCKQKCYNCFKGNCPPCLKTVRRTMPKCSHEQSMKCHISVEEHMCSSPCERKLDCEHKCQKKCSEPCTAMCDVIVHKTLPCGHGIDIKCYRKDIDCEIIVKKKLPCGHETKVRCCLDPEDILCSVIVSLKCPTNSGHEYKTKCHKKKLKLCDRNCAKVIDCGHICEGYCGQCHTKKRHSDCQSICERELSCKHKCQNMCIEPCTAKCDVMVIVTLPCGHEIRKQCYKDIKNITCEQIVEKELPCGHKDGTECHTNPNDILCTKSVSLTCRDNPSHEYQVACYCSKETGCNHECGFVFHCGHSCKRTCAQCNESKSHGDCTMQCNKTLVCGHQCQHKCIECETMGHHSLCCSLVQWNLDCGHMVESRCNFLPANCKSPCGMLCPHRNCDKSCGENCEPCTKRCVWQCPHVKCYKLCYEPCSRRCNRACYKQLKCGHKCSGYCGEPCIQTCYQCEKDQFIQTAKNLNYRIQKPWGFVRLQPCNHIIQGFFMDAFMHNEMKCMKDKQIIKYFKCPLCNAAIRYCPRYSSFISAAEEKMTSVKGLQTLETKRLDLLFRVIESHDQIITTLHLPSSVDLLRYGIMCLLQATLDAYNSLEELLYTQNKSKTTRPGVTTLYESYKQEIHTAKVTVKDMIVSTENVTKSLYILVPSLEMLLRSIVSFLDLSTNRQDRAKQYILQEMIQTLQSLDYLMISKRADPEKVDTLARVCKLVDRHFSNYPNITGNVSSLMGLIKHYFTPVLLVPPGKEHHWIQCNKGRIHYLPNNQKSRKGAIGSPNKCAICESEVFPKDMFQTCISPLSNWKSLKLDCDIHYNFFMKRLSFLKTYQFEEIATNVENVENEYSDNEMSECHKSNDSQSEDCSEDQSKMQQQENPKGQGTLSQNNNKIKSKRVLSYNAKHNFRVKDKRHGSVHKEVDNWRDKSKSADIGNWRDKSKTMDHTTLQHKSRYKLHSEGRITHHKRSRYANVDRKVPKKVISLEEFLSQ